MKSYLRIFNFICICAFILMDMQTAQSKVIYVSIDASPNGDGLNWDSAVRTIQEGIRKAERGDEIWISEGQYSNDVAIRLKPNISLYGGFSGMETSREERNWEQNQTIIERTNGIEYTIVCADQIVLDGLIIDGLGISEFAEADYPGNGLSAIYCENVTAEIHHLILRNVIANRSALYASKSNLIVSDCTFHDNQATLTYEGVGGALRSIDSTIEINRCTFRENIAHGHTSGFGYYGGGGGFYCRNSNFTVRECVLQSNSSPDGGGAFTVLQSNVTAENCLITENETWGWNGGGAVLCCGGSTTLLNCTVTGNQSVDGGTFYVQSRGFLEDIVSPLELRNCISWNYGNEIYIEENDQVQDQVVVENCCIRGGWEGEGNINVYPEFVDLSNGDYRLKDGSPCIDAGNPQVAPSMDLLGNPRPGDDKLVDMGAYEATPAYQTEPPRAAPKRLYVCQDATGNGDGSSWENAFKAIREALFLIDLTGEIWIANGSYNEKIVMCDPISLYGGFNGTETSVEERNLDLQNSIIRASVILSSDCLLDGLTIAESQGIRIREGKPRIHNCVVSNNTSNGIRIYNATPVIQNCDITENNGTAIWVRGAGEFIGCTIARNTLPSGFSGSSALYIYGSPRFVRCIIMDNHSHHSLDGAIRCDSGEPHFEQCVFSNNTSFYDGDMGVSGGAGAGLFYDSRPTFVHCVIRDNVLEIQGNMSVNSSISGGITLMDDIYSPSPEISTSAVLKNCLFLNNQCVHHGVSEDSLAAGAISANHTTIDLWNCIIAGNSCSMQEAENTSAGAGAIASSESEFNLYNCTITENRCEDHAEMGAASAGGLIMTTSSFTVDSSILWNPGEEIIATGGWIVQYSCIEGSYDGPGNIESTPLFVQPWSVEGFDFHLSLDSPCVDAGNPDALYNDAELPPGLESVRCDIGAYGGPENGGWLDSMPPLGVKSWGLY